MGTFRLPHDTAGRKAWTWRVASAVVILGLLLYMSRGLTGRMLNPWIESYLPPAWYAATEGHEDPVEWRDDYVAALAEGKRSGKPIFLDFTGVLCINCREFEAAVFDKPDFIAAMDDFIPVRLYTDRRGEYEAGDEENQRIMREVYGTGTLPFYVVLSPEGDEWRRSGYARKLLEVEEFLNFLYGDETARAASPALKVAMDDDDDN